jgi:hypothetical protein
LQRDDDLKPRTSTPPKEGFCFLSASFHSQHDGMPVLAAMPPCWHHIHPLEKDRSMTKVFLNPINNPGLSIPKRQEAWLDKLFHRNSRRTGFKRKVEVGRRVHVQLPPQLRAGEIGSAVLVTLENDRVVCRDAATGREIISINAAQEDAAPFVATSLTEEAANV